MDKHLFLVPMDEHSPSTEKLPLYSAETSHSKIKQKSKRIGISAVVANLLVIFVLVSICITAAYTFFQTTNNTESMPGYATTLYKILLTNSFPDMSRSPFEKWASVFGHTSEENPDTSDHTSEHSEHVTDEFSLAPADTEVSESTGTSHPTDSDAGEETSKKQSNTESQTDLATDIPCDQEVERLDVSRSDRGKLYIYNTTIFRQDPERLYTLDPFENSPAVLIVCSHPYESYIDSDTLTRSADITSLASILADKLAAAGINAIFAELPSSSGTVDSSNCVHTEALIKYYLNLYPAIDLVIDLRRSAELTVSGALLATDCKIEDISYSQIRIICDSRNVDNHTARTLSFALQLRSALWSVSPELSRPVWLREGDARDHDVLSLTVEIGAAGNTYEESENSMYVFARVVSELLLTV